MPTYRRTDAQIQEGYKVIKQYLDLKRDTHEIIAAMQDKFPKLGLRQIERDIAEVRAQRKQQLSDPKRALMSDEVSDLTYIYRRELVKKKPDNGLLIRSKELIFKYLEKLPEDSSHDANATHHIPSDLESGLHKLLEHYDRSPRKK